MIVTIYNLLILLQAVYLLGNVYAAVKFYKLPHRWGSFVAVSFLANAAQALLALFTLGFGPRLTEIVWWFVALTILGQIVKAGGIVVLNLFLFGWINGLGGFAKPEVKNDAE